MADRIATCHDKPSSPGKSHSRLTLTTLHGLRTLTGWLLSFAAVVPTIGCQTDLDDAQDLVFWAFGAEGKAVELLVAEFEQANPGINVHVQQIPWTAAHEKLLTAFVGDALPDVCQLGNTWIPEFAALDALEPLDALIESSDTLAATDYFPGIWATNISADAVYGVPWYVDTRVLFYRRDLLSEIGFQQPPATWDELREVAARLRKKMTADQFPFLLPINEWEQITIFGMQVTDGLLRDGMQYGNFRSSGFQRAFRFYLQMFEEGYAPRVRNTEVPNIYQEFSRERFAMYITGPWNLGEFRLRLPPEVLEQWSTAPLPGPDAPQRGVSMAGGCSLVLLRSSGKKAVAWRLIEFLSEPEQQLRFYELVGNLPARIDAWDDRQLVDDRWTTAFREQLTRVEPTPRVPEWEQIATRISESAERAIDHVQTEQQALSSLDRQVDAILEKRRWLLAKSTQQ